MSNWAKIKTINVHGTGPGNALSSIWTSAAPTYSAPIDMQEWDSATLYVTIGGTAANASATCAHLWLQFSPDQEGQNFAPISAFSCLVLDPSDGVNVNASPQTWIIPLTANDMQWLRVATSGTAETRAASAMGWVVLSRKVTATVTRDLA